MNKERLKEFQRAMKNMENKYRILNMENIDLKTSNHSYIFQFWLIIEELSFFLFFQKPTATVD